MKTGVFKKIVALAAVVAMVCSFAVCASAVEVTTITKYVNGNSEKVSVKATVSGIGATSEKPIEVTYYAENDNATETGKVVYVDQATATSDSVDFEFVTKATYLKSGVKVGYTNGTAKTDEIKGYTLTCEDETVTIPTEGGTIVVPYEPEDGKTVATTGAVTVTSDNATLDSYLYYSGYLTLVLSGIKGDVVVDVADTDPSESNPAGAYVTGGLVIANGENDVDVDGNELDDDAQASEDDRKLTVVGKVTGLAQGAEYGIIVSESEIDEGGQETLPEGAYSALEKNASGIFAVQLIDEGKGDEAYIKAGTPYYTAIYYEADGKYHVVCGEILNVE